MARTHSLRFLNGPQRKVKPWGCVGKRETLYLCLRRGSAATILKGLVALKNHRSLLSVKGEWEGSYTYIFVLPTDFSCCVLSSVWVTLYTGSGLERSPPSIATDKLFSQLDPGPWKHSQPFLHMHTETNTHIHIHKYARTYALSKCFPLSGPSFLISKMGDNSLCLARGSSEFRDIEVGFANYKVLGRPCWDIAHPVCTQECQRTGYCSSL